MSLRETLRNIYIKVEDMMKEVDLESLDQYICSHNVEEHSTGILLALLVSSCPVKDKLKSRNIFLAKVEEELRKRGQYNNRILDGL